ncbi:MAG: cytochrome c [Chromatiaceae bacterium]|jgi:mono/diheme cytochrome c family protein
MRIARPLLIPLVLLTPPCAAAESEGQDLHDQHCLVCHGTDVYTRDNRMIHTAAQLKAQVQRCAKGAAKVNWTPDQIAAVTRYLDQGFYHF